MDHNEHAAGTSSDPADINEAFQRALEEPEPVPVDPDAIPCDPGGTFTQVCSCGMDFLHPDRCARCAARNGRLICGKANNHRGPHQAIAIWTDMDARLSHARLRPPRRHR